MNARKCGTVYIFDEMYRRNENMKIRKSAEDYLEAMLMLEEEHGYIRSIDIAKKLGVSKPSVAVAAKKLKESGYINMDANGPILLAPPGRKIAERIYERHKALTEFLVLLGVDRDTAEEDACKIEHDISHDTYVAISNYISQHADTQPDR